MSTQAILKEVISFCALNNVEIIKIIAEEDGTKVQSHDAEKTLFIEGSFGTVPEFVGEFGISNLKMLSGLINFSQGDGASSFKANLRTVDGSEVLDQFEFKGRGAKSVFKLMDAAHIPEQAKIASIPWGFELTDLSKDRFSEFQTFAGLYSEVDKQFGITVVDGELIFSFGQEASSTHSGSISYGKVDGTLKNPLLFPVDKFAMLMKLALSREKSKLMFTDKGLLGVEIEADYGLYRYYLRQSVR